MTSSAQWNGKNQIIDAHIFHLPASTAGQLLTTIRFVPGAGICKLNAVFVDTPTHTHGIVALSRLVEPGLVAVGRVIANQVAVQATTDGGARPVRLLEAAAPLARANRPVLIEVAEINERLDALLVLRKSKTGVIDYPSRLDGDYLPDHVPGHRAPAATSVRRRSRPNVRTSTALPAYSWTRSELRTWER